MKHILYITIISILSFGCDSDKSNEENPKTTNETIVDQKSGYEEVQVESKGPLQEIEEINGLVSKIKKSELTKTEFIYYDVYGDQWELKVHRNGDGFIKRFSMSKGGEFDEITSYFLDGNDVCMISVLQMQQGRWVDDRTTSYYLKDREPFYQWYKHQYKEDYISDTGSVFTQFTEEHAIMLYTRAKDVDELISVVIPSELHVNREDFKLTDGYQMTQGSETPDMPDRTEEVEDIPFIGFPSGITYFDPETEKSIFKIVDMSKDEIMYIYEENFTGKLHFSGIVNNNYLLEVPDGLSSYELAIIGLESKEILYRKPVFGQTFINKRLQVMRPVTNEFTESIPYKGDCSEFVAQNMSYQRYGVFEIDLNTFKETFTNQIFCVYEM